MTPEYSDELSALIKNWARSKKGLRPNGMIALTASIFFASMEANKISPKDAKVIIDSLYEQYSERNT